MRSVNRLIATLLIAGLAAAGCSDDDGPERDEDGQITEEGNLGAFSMEVGDCFDDPAGLELDTQSTVLDLPAVPCANAHDNEVFALIQLEGDDDDYPGTDAVIRQGETACEAAFEDYVGVAYAESALEMAPYLYPTEQTWGGGDREIVCALYHAELEPLTGSKASSGE